MNMIANGRTEAASFTRRTLLVVLCAAIGLTRGVKADDPAVAFERQEEGLLIDIGGKPFARYRPGSEAISRPFVEPGSGEGPRRNPPSPGNPDKLGLTRRTPSSFSIGIPDNTNGQYSETEKSAPSCSGNR